LWEGGAFAVLLWWTHEDLILPRFSAIRLMRPHFHQDVNMLACKLGW